LTSTQIQSASLDGPTMTVTGVATMNGVPGYRFTAWVADRTPDAFSIRIIRPDGTLFYEYGGSIQGGDLVVVQSSR
jgi:hypothetical protein